MSLSLLTQTIQIFKQVKEELVVTPALLSNLFELADNNYNIIGSLLYGSFSEFTNPGIAYSKDTVALIKQYLIKKLKKFVLSPLQTIYLIKFVFVLSNLKTQNSDPDLGF